MLWYQLWIFRRSCFFIRWILTCLKGRAWECPLWALPDPDRPTGEGMEGPTMGPYILLQETPWRAPTLGTFGSRHAYKGLHWAFSDTHAWGRASVLVSLGFWNTYEASELWVLLDPYMPTLGRFGFWHAYDYYGGPLYSEHFRMLVYCFWSGGHIYLKWLAE